jgi:hypothetical protein
MKSQDNQHSQHSQHNRRNKRLDKQRDSQRPLR